MPQASASPAGGGRHGAGARSGVRGATGVPATAGPAGALRHREPRLRGAMAAFA